MGSHQTENKQALLFIAQYNSSMVDIKHKLANFPSYNSQSFKRKDTVLSLAFKATQVRVCFVIDTG